MRKTTDLINEMKSEAKTAYMVAIAVGFTNETKFVFSTSRYPLEELNKLIQQGGSPIGLLRFEKEGQQIQGLYRPFEEYADADWVKGYLAGLLDNATEIVALGRDLPKFPVAY